MGYDGKIGPIVPQVLPHELLEEPSFLQVLGCPRYGTGPNLELGATVRKGSVHGPRMS